MSAGDAILARVARVLDVAPPAVTPIGAAILVAAAGEIARDSRGFARLLGVAHALVLRDCVTLDDAGLIRIERRDDRTQRLFYALTETGRALLAGAGAEPEGSARGLNGPAG